MCQNKLRVIQAVFISFCLFSFSKTTNGANIPLPLGIVFGQGSPEVQTAFKHALLTFSLNITTNPRDVYRFTAYVDTINTADAFKLSKLICNQFSRGIYAMVGSMNAESFYTYHAFANTFHMPLITPWYPIKETSGLNKGQNAGQNGNNVVVGPSNTGMDFATRIRPDFSPAILDTIHYYGWKELIYFYSTNEGLLRLQTLFYRPSKNNQMLKVKVVKKINSANDAIAVLRSVEAVERFTPKYVLLDTPTPLAKEIILAHVRDVQLGRRTYHYLLSDLTFDEKWESNILEFNAINITGFRMVDTSRKYVQDFLSKWSTLDASQFPGAGKSSISANAAFQYDAMLIIKESFTDILTDNPFAFSRYSAESACESGSDFLDDIRPFEYGQNVNQHLRRVQTEGLTGNLQFHENGTRKYFSVDVIELRENATKVKIAHWTDYSGFKVETPSVNDYADRNPQNQEKDVYVISSILEEPFLRLKDPSQRKSLTGNDIYEGFVKDFADVLFTNLNAAYRIQLVRDGKYGSKIPTNFGENWNGIVGELIRNEVDLSISPLTITSERERVIEFSKPFLTQGISIMGYKPRKHTPGIFSFMNPLSEWVWLSVIGAYVGVSIVFYLIYRLTTAHQLEQAQFIPHHQQQQQQQRVNGELNAKFAQQNQNQMHLLSVQQGTNSNSNHSAQTTTTTTTQMYLIQKKQKGQNLIPPSNFLWMTFSILTSNRGNHYVSRSFAGKFATTVWWMFALIFVAIYTGNYIAIRMRNRNASPIRSALDLVDRSGIQYGTLQSGSTYDFFKNSENQVYRAMFEHMNGPNQQNMPTYEDGINMVRQKKGKYVFLMESSKIEYVSNHRPCNTMKIGYDLGDVHYGVGLPMNSPLTKKINLEITKLHENQVFLKLQEKWWMSKIHCQVATKLDQLNSATNEDELLSLSLGNMCGLFYILIIGMVIAVLVSFLEFFCSSSSSFSSRKESSNPNTLNSPIPKIHQHHGQDTLLLHRNSHSHCHSSHQNTIIDSVPMPNDFCDISPDMNTNK